jgi:serine/threonine protein kinase
MGDSPWQRVEELFHQAAELAPEARPAFLDQACAGDESLRREVESLLAHDAEGGSTLAKAVAGAAGDAAAITEDLSGRTIGPYRVLRRIGTGGMGVVYQARDTQLDRSVAIKVLPADRLADPDRKRRFIREAKAASALNHPNIVTIHTITNEGGADCIVMEYVEGKTLAEAIPKKGLPLKDAVHIAIEIADAMAAAHKAGIVHRDLKSDNIMLTREGRVKVLDFGLAQVRAEQLNAAATETLTVRTEPGMVMGTVGYMSPEQAEGKEVDARSDIFSFGSVLYEMLTGRRAFRRETPALTLAAILHLEPPALPEGTPGELERIVARCLRKDPARRFQHMDDVKVALEELKEESESGKLAGIPPTGPPRRWRWPWAIAAVAMLLLAAAAVWRLWEGTPSSSLRAVALTSYSGIERQPSLSPDGSKVAFSWNGDKEDNFDIYVKQIGGSGTPVRLTTDPAADSDPAWSPDDRWIAFVRQQKGNYAVLLMPSVGGPERKLVEIAGPVHLSWTPDAKWLAFHAQDSPPQGPFSIWAINVDTDERRRLTTFVTQSAGAESPLGDYSPSISPDGSALAFARELRSFIYELYVQRLTRDLRPKGEPARVTDRRYASAPGIAWTADGREIVYSAGGINIQSLWRVPASGGRAPERLPFATPAAIQPVISRSPPRLVYTWQIIGLNIWRLDIHTRERKMLISSTYRQNIPHYSPDGRKIAFQSNRSGNFEVWTCDADGSNCQQITFFDGPDCGSPRWSPDSRWLALDSGVEGRSEIYVVAADGGTPRRITNHPRGDLLPSWSHDGLWIYFASDRSGQYQVWKTPKDGGEPVQVTRSGGYGAFESPDGKYIYYPKFSQPGLYRMPAQGGEETQILEAFPARDFAGFEVTSKGVYFVMPDYKTIRFLDSATGKIGAVAVLDKPSGELTVSPDGAYLAWSQLDRNSADLMLVDGFR